LKAAAFFLALTTLSLVWAQEPTSTVTPQPTLSESQIDAMEEINVSTKRVGIGRKEISGDDAQDIRNNGDLSGVLDHESGLETQGEGLGKTWNTLAIRGQSFRETVVLVNGQRVPESFNLGTIPTENIEKVEVLEGPQALAYGSDALGGVINILTRKAENNPWSLQVSGGDFSTYQFQGSTPSFSIGSIHNTLSGSYFTTDGYSPLPQDPITGLKFTDEVHWDISHSANLKTDGGELALATSFFRHIGSAPDADNVIAAGTDQYDLDGRQDAWGLQSTFGLSQDMGGGWKLAPALFGNYSDVLRANPIGADPTSGVYEPYRNQYLNYGGQVYLTGKADEGIPKVSLGLEARDEDMWSGLYENHTRQEGSLVAGATLRFSDSLRLDFFNRLDDFNDFGVWDSPSGTLVLDATKDVQFHLSGGKGEKMPTFDQLFLPLTDFAALPPDLAAQFAGSPFGGVWGGDKGNPNLVPEQSLSGELGVDVTAGNFLIQLSGFANYYQDLINPAVDPADNFWTYVNIDHALFIGTEDSVKYHLTDVLAPYVSATYINATDDAGNPIPGRLRFKFASGLDLRPEKQWSLDLNARFVDRNPVATQYLTDLGFPAPPTDYWSLSAEVKYTISEHMKGFITVQNILNEPIVSFQGLPYPGRTFQGGVQTTF